MNLNVYRFNEFEFQPDFGRRLGSVPPVKLRIPSENFQNAIINSIRRRVAGKYQ